MLKTIMRHLGNALVLLVVWRAHRRIEALVRDLKSLGERQQTLACQRLQQHRWQRECGGRDAARDFIHVRLGYDLLRRVWACEQGR